jgi:hypothetical protein
MKMASPMEFIKKKIAAWEIKHGQIAITGKECKELFKDYLGKPFNLKSFVGNFSNRHLLESGYSFRLACKPFLSKLSVGYTIYLKPLEIHLRKYSPLRSLPPRLS